MTKDELRRTTPLDIKAALTIAFHAGESYGMASHKDFVQLHEPVSTVVDSLMRRLNKEDK